MSLSVRQSILSAMRHKAVVDADKMQLAVEEECNKNGKPVPEYRLRELIGKGSFGRIYKATNKKDGELVAVKIIDVDHCDSLDPERAETYSEFIKEVNALQTLREGGAQNINYILEALPVGRAMWMVIEYCAGGSVATLMKPTAPGGLQEKLIIPILRETAVAISWVHKAGIIHRDIKCANVLVTEQGGVQLCDFGVAGMMETKFDKRSTFIGTLHWMAPELFDQNAQYGTEVDVWAFGSMVYEIASGLPPNARTFNNPNPREIGGFLREHVPRLEGPQYSNELKNLVAFCLEESPEKRPTIQQVQEHPYIRNTSEQYPSSSLSALVRAYKLWEERGGDRRSLFNPMIGAAAPGDLASTAMDTEEWNFSTTLAFDNHLHDNTDGMTDIDAVRNVYGSQVDFPTNGNNSGFGEDTAHQKTKTGRRRPPPQALAAMKVPLEKVFDPNTISNYIENSQAYYGRSPIPPPTASASDLPLRDDSLHATLRESLIDLDASLGGDELSRFVDMDTIRPGGGGGNDLAGSRTSMDNGWSFSSATDPDYNRAPLSDPADFNNGRLNGPDWQWPTNIPPASANPDVTHFSLNEEHTSNGRPRLMHHPTEPIGLPSQGYDMQAPRSNNDRMSVASLIDLDEGLVDVDPTGGLATLPELTRPSTANSDVASVAGSELGGTTSTNPFELEKHTSVYTPLPMTNREPSIYVSDDSDFANHLAKVTSADTSLHHHDLSIGSPFSPNSNVNNNHMGPDPTADLPIPTSYPQQFQHGNGNSSGGVSGNHQHLPSLTHHYNDRSISDSSQSYINDGEPDYDDLDGPRHHRSHHHQSSLPGIMGGIPFANMIHLPPVAPPNAAVMEARASTGEVVDEMKRLIGSLSEHLSVIGNQVGAMEVRKGGLGMGGLSGQEDYGVGVGGGEDEEEEE